jgi:ABC-type Fe3+ transport system permease subunit
LLESSFASVGVSVLTVLLCAAVGVPLAFLFERYTCRRWLARSHSSFFSVNPAF